MKLPEKEQLVIIGIAVVVVVGFAVFRYYPIASRSIGLKQVKATQMSEKARVHMQTLQLPVLCEEKDRLEKKLSNYDKKAPLKRNFSMLWEQITAEMNRLNLKEQKIEPGLELKGEELNCIPIKIECTGTLSQMFELFTSLEGFDRIIYIESIELTGGSQNTGQVKLNAGAKVYYRSVAESSV